MQLRDRPGVIDNHAYAAVREHWSTKLETTCQALARAPGRQMTGARVSQQGCGVPDEERLVSVLAESLAREFGLAAVVRPTSNRLSVLFERVAAA